MIIDNIKIIAQDGITEEEINSILTEEKVLWHAKGKEIAEIHLTLDNEEIIVKSFEKSPIKRIRRITGYLSEQTNFNDGKIAELHDRYKHA